ncbi:MAG: ATP-binding protein [Deltaproteobacteria bacterium]|nr:ATP-binding protein [Deltaproteobacteria bacterium]
MIKSHFSSVHTINLLLDRHESRLARDPDALIGEVTALSENITHVFIDEIQKVPKLCDIVHHLIEDKKVPQKFILTGSSARKLKMAGANLLAGRALYFNLYPFSYRELGAHFDFEKAIRFGLLPQVWQRSGDQSIIRFLRAYGQTYLKEEVWAEHLVRKLEPFRKFLEVAAQHNARLINYSRVATVVGVDIKTVQTYFQILEETHLAVLLEPYSRSIRQQVHAAPRFYFVDTGIARTLSLQVGTKLSASTGEFGHLFEQFFVMECIKLNQYLELGYRFSYLTTKAGAEIDLIIERPGQATILMEIKSSSMQNITHARHLTGFRDDFEDPVMMVVSQDEIRSTKDGIIYLNWRDALNEIFSA